MDRLPVRSPMWPLQHAVDRLFDDEFYRSNMGDLLSAWPALDMFETDDAVVVKAAVPGFQPDDIQVSITGNALTIKGNVSKEHEDESKERNYIFRERREASFSRTLALPHGVGPDATAEFENGVLTLTLPKPEEAKPKTVQIQAK